MKKLIQRQQELLSTAKAAQRELTAEEQAEFDSLQRQIEAAPEAQTERAATPENKADDIDAVREAERKAERTRIREIEGMCKHFGIESKEYVERGISADGARKEIMEKLMQENTPIPQKVEVVSDAADKFRAAASDAILMRSGMQIEKPAEDARSLMSMSLRDLFIESMAAEGQTGLNRKSSDDLYSMALRQFFCHTFRAQSMIPWALFFQVSSALSRTLQSRISSLI